MSHQQPDLFSNPSHSHPQKKLSSQERIQQLRQELRHHNTLYYQHNKPEISDSEFDSLLNELKNLEAQHPELYDPLSPTQQVGGAPSKSSEGFTTRPHLRPMLSIEDIHELKPEEQNSTTPPLSPYHNLSHWLQRTIRHLSETGEHPFPLTIEPKIDGVAITLIYRNQKLDYALTRGDGQTGDDVTHNIRTIQSIPLTLSNKAPDLFEVRGEVFMPHEAFLKLNEQRSEQGETPFVNPRNATAGTLKHLDSKVVKNRPLDCLFHSYGEVSTSPYSSLLAFREFLSSEGFSCSQWFSYIQSEEELYQALHNLDQKRHYFPYATDGAVIKVNELSHHDLLGHTAKFPRWACAFKFLPEQKETRLNAITIQVGRTGVLTPVAELEPVFISGTTVSRATLHNQEEIQKKDLRLGDTVLVEKAGEIIPSILKVILKKRPPQSHPYDLVKALNNQCPSCQGAISQEAGYTAYRCTNFSCPAQAVTRIKHFASRKALDLEGLGESLAQKLVDHRLTLNPLHLFTLQEEQLAQLLLDPAQSKTGEFISKPRLFGKKRASKLIQSLEKARSNAPLHRWIFAMGIPHIGERTAYEIARLHSTFSELPHSPILKKIAQIAQIEDAQKKVSPYKQATPLTNEEQNNRKEQFTHYKEQLITLKTDLQPYQISSELGSVAAQSLLNYFSSSVGQDLLQQFHQLGLNPQSTNYAPKPPQQDSSHAPLSGKLFVITGTLSRPRADIKRLIEKNGGKVTSSLSGKTDFLLAGEQAGSKRAKAEHLGTTILQEADLEQLFSTSL